MHPEYAQAANAHAAGYGAPQTDTRPLEEIGRLASELEQKNAIIGDYLNRFDGPLPVALGESRDPAVRPPTSYRFEIERLRKTVEETGSLVDRLTRLG